jgi:hypothetical protein
MSRVEPDQYINDRYQAIEDRLKVSQLKVSARCRHCPHFSQLALLPCSPPPRLVQVVRKRLNRPLTYAEKVSTQQGCGSCIVTGKWQLCCS